MSENQPMSAEKGAGVMTETEVQRLATYNAERARGIMHTPEWDAQMAELQRRFDEKRSADVIEIERVCRDAERDQGHPFHIGTPEVQEALREQLAEAWREGHRFCRCGDSDMRHANPYESEPRPSETEVADWYYVTPRPCSTCVIPPAEKGRR